MKKFLLWVVGIIFVLVAAVFVLLFTSFGNGILKPYIEAQINKYSPLEVKLDKFVLRFSSFELGLSSMGNIFVDANGNYSLFAQNIDGILNLKIKQPQNIKELEGLGIKLNEEFVVNNVVRGKFSDLLINTNSALANGLVRIDTRVLDYSPAKITANISNVDIQKLLAMLGQKPYASGKFDLSADIDGKNLNFTGSANAHIKDGSVSREIVKKDFNLDIPATNFNVNLDGKFNGKELNHNLEFLSNIGNINSKGVTQILNIKTDSNYSINIANLSPFTPFVGMPLKGSFKTNGKIVGNAAWLNIDGRTDFAGGDSTYSISLENFSKPKDALINIKNVQIEDVLYTLVKPIYAKGSINANIDVKGISSALSGNYNHKISANAQKAVIKKEFDYDLPNNLAFSNNAKITFDKGVGLINTDVVSEIARLDVKNALLNIKQVTLDAPYTINIPDLKKVAFITGKELKGEIKADGKINYDKNKPLYADFNSKLFGGALNATLNNNLANVILKDMNSLGMLEMLQYPKMFKSSVNGNVKYDTLTKRGNFELIAADGAFSQNKLTDLLQATLNFNATKEVYNNVKVDGNINNKLVNANLNMTSNNTSLNAKNAKIDLERDSIDAYATLKIQKNELGAIINGKLSDPKVSLDTKKLAKDAIKNLINTPKAQEQKEKIEQKIDEQKKALEQKASDAIKDGLKNLFKK